MPRSIRLTTSSAAQKGSGRLHGAYTCPVRAARARYADPPLSGTVLSPCASGPRPRNACLASADAQDGQHNEDDRGDCANAVSDNREDGKWRSGGTASSQSLTWSLDEPEVPVGHVRQALLRPEGPRNDDCRPGRRCRWCWNWPVPRARPAARRSSYSTRSGAAVARCARTRSATRAAEAAVRGRSRPPWRGALESLWQADARARGAAGWARP